VNGVESSETTPFRYRCRIRPGAARSIGLCPSPAPHTFGDGGLLSLLCNATIGLSAFWIVDASPVQWVWQKSSFVLGGLFVPLSLYPSWLRTLALMTPFSALLHGPGSMVFGFDPRAAVHTALKLVAWIAVATVLLVVLHRRGLRVVNIHGG
jgi:ABC-2 type transport system permease protein